MWHGYCSCEVNLTESTVVVLPAVEVVLAGVGVDNEILLITGGCDPVLFKLALSPVHDSTLLIRSHTKYEITFVAKVPWKIKFGV